MHLATHWVDGTFKYLVEEDAWECLSSTAEMPGSNVRRGLCIIVVDPFSNCRDTIDIQESRTPCASLKGRNEMAHQTYWVPCNMIYPTLGLSSCLDSQSDRCCPLTCKTRILRLYVCTWDVDEPGPVEFLRWGECLSGGGDGGSIRGRKEGASPQLHAPIWVCFTPSPSGWM